MASIETRAHTCTHESVTVEVLIPSRVIGIDPGISGAIAVLTDAGDLVTVHDMPILADGAKSKTKGKRRNSVSAPLLRDIIAQIGPTQAFLEDVHAQPRDGAAGAFGFGRSKGVIEGVLAGLGIPVRMVAPQTWKRVVGIKSGTDKDGSRSEAIRRFPSKAALFARVKDDGRAEAALIGVAGMRGRGAA